MPKSTRHGRGVEDIAPGPRSALVEAVRLAQAGDRQSAHVIAQGHEGDPQADWLHAVVHRVEGDLGNAAYWYRRCRRPLREDLPTETELQELAAALDP
jgi:hypothetical protein